MRDLFKFILLSNILFAISKHYEGVVFNEIAKKTFDLYTMKASLLALAIMATVLLDLASVGGINNTPRVIFLASNPSYNSSLQMHARKIRVSQLKFAS